MSWVAAAIVGAGALGAGATVYGSGKASQAQTNAATTASNTQANIAAQNIAAQQRISQQNINALQTLFGQALPLQRGIADTGVNWQTIGYGKGADALQPFINNGTFASPLLQRLLTPGADMNALLEQMPGFKFAQEWGNKGITNQATMRGLGGNVLKAGADYSSGVAQNTYGNIVNQLQALLQTGQGAATSLGGLALGAAGNIGSLLSNYGGQITGAFSGLGQGISGALGQLGNQYGGTLNNLSSSIGSNLLGIGNAQAGASMAGAGAIGGLGNSLALASIIRGLSPGGSNSNPGIYGQIPPGADWTAPTYGISGN